MYPYGTPDGHAVSHARHPRHWAMCVSTLSLVGSSVPSSNARMRTMRPRGLSFSSSSVRYVGQLCRQNPQCTHASIPACSFDNGLLGSAHSGGTTTGALMSVLLEFR